MNIYNKSIAGFLWSNFYDLLCSNSDYFLTF